MANAIKDGKWEMFKEHNTLSEACSRFDLDHFLEGLWEPCRPNERHASVLKSKLSILFKDDILTRGEWSPVPWFSFYGLGFGVPWAPGGGWGRGVGRQALEGPWREWSFRPRP
jgi:hypothetical protein